MTLALESALFSKRSFYSRASSWVSAAGPHPVETIRRQQEQKTALPVILRKFSEGTCMYNPAGVGGVALATQQ